MAKKKHTLIHRNNLCMWAGNLSEEGNVVRVKGLEPPRHRRQNLNLVRLPIPPHPHISTDQITWVDRCGVSSNGNTKKREET